VSRGQASERSVFLYQAVSVEQGARRPPLPAAVAFATFVMHNEKNSFF
jgi:hypothetical protein